ncbi:F-box protein CPR1-like [Bidens hawaiensis]|uniref:F-box protein CPR1-like n=1 Tax=Bidens hawaiensis TaxID=980011 RepID=UPI00404B866F
MASLPQDIFFEIFARLSTKPLVRSRFLSKHWNRLISDYFTKSKSRRMIRLPFQPLQAIHNTFKPSDGTVHLIPTSMLTWPFNNIVSVDRANIIGAFQVSEDRVIVIGTFKGIVVLFCKNIILFNPLTGAFKMVPDPPLDSDYHSVDTYGLCYGTTLDDLKIVKLRLGVHYSYQVYCDVFSLKKGLWSTKSIKLEGKYTVRPYYWYNGTFANGFLYWIVLKPDGMYVTLALDVKEMVISEIKLLGNFNSRDSLCTLRGRLHIFHISNMTYDLWVMNEDGMEKSWLKVLTLNIAPSGSHIPLSVIDASKIVMLDCMHHMQIIIYDMFKDSYVAEYSGYNLHWSAGSLWGSQAMEYVESLISPSHLFSTW